MRNLFMIVAAALSLTACSNTKKTAASKEGLVVVMSTPEVVNTGSPVMLHFTVHNRSATPLQFCKWHTPFEGFISSFLEIKQADGTEVQYRGAMAKRIMPPPAEAYITVPAKDSVSVDIDLLRGYALTKPGGYKAVYRDGNMSGLMKVNDISFTLE